MNIRKDSIHFKSVNANEMYTIADNSLINFFDSFSYILNQSGLYVCTCKHCKEKYLDNKITNCCYSKKCKTLSQPNKLKIKSKKNDNDKTIFELHGSILENIRVYKCKINKATNDPQILNEYDQLIESKIITSLNDEYKTFKSPKTTPATQEFLKLKRNLYTQRASIIDELEKKYNFTITTK